MKIILLPEIYEYMTVSWCCTDAPIKTPNVIEIRTEILKCLKLRKFSYSALKSKKSSRIEPLTGGLSSRVSIQQGNYKGAGLNCFKPSIFSFVFLPPAIHRCISNMYLIIIGVCNTKTGPKLLFYIAPQYSLSYSTYVVPIGMDRLCYIAATCFYISKVMTASVKHLPIVDSDNEN